MSDRRQGQVCTVVLGLVVMSAALMALPHQAFGAGKCVPDGSCSAATPACNQTTWGVDNCGNSCSKWGGACCVPGTCSAPTPSCNQTQTWGTDGCNACQKWFSSVCSAPEPSCGQKTTTGMWNCPAWGTCGKTFSPNPEICSAPTPACGQKTTGTWTCGGGCDKTGQACSPWQPYGFAVPGDPVYGFPQVQKKGVPVLDVASKDLVGLAAKGNIIIGDSTSPLFKNNVLPNLKPGPSSKTQPYVVDPTDADLGYSNGDVGNLCKGKSPCFGGDYTVQDKDGLLDGTQTDGDKRLFYESTLKDSAFKPLVNMPTGTMTVDAVLYTNHALAGWIPASSALFNGALVGRDDGVMTNGAVRVSHDIRLLDGAFAQQVVLPLTISRPTVKKFQECTAANPCP